MKQFVAVIAAALLAPSALLAGEAAPDAAHKDSLEKLTRAISKQHAGELARFEDAVCIAVSGFDDPYNAIFARRMARDAAQAGLQVAGPGCRPNIVVILTDRPRQELTSLARQGGFIDSIGARQSDVQHLAQSTGPAWLMTFTEQRNTDGNPAHFGTDVDHLAPQMHIYESSIINPASREDIAAVLMVIDSNAAMGKTLSQIADYAAFRSLADLKDAVPETGEPTILTLFSDNAAPRALSPYDQAYLKSLYHGPSAMKAEARIHDIVNTALRVPG